MLSIQNKNDTAIIVVHEIYGINKHMKTVCEMLSLHGFDVFCPNLLDKKPFDYSEEAFAYDYFMETIGFTKASNKIKDVLIEAKKTYKKVFIVGFSVGATIAWLCSEECSVDGIVGYYGSRIRNYVDLSPRCAALLFFPEEEKSFHVDGLIEILTNKQIEVHKLQGQHGFSDPNSLKYNEDSAQNAFKDMLCFINSLT
ncbi:dienelactone hydrolase family protein [Psychrobacillus vulpis]|uniref:Dienelactone hydrolase family protein n=1 Tax=Psychrobacillus vulpis TaxID=2325572 RepID=A0A544TNQ5_9BACI|nr:dienelactone hydrolase family protein [Psychrobacillus vulpis]TQR19083.1 dienelactone hydrolase family protein [Psychrobacillus vulpis]